MEKRGRYSEESLDQPASELQSRHPFYWSHPEKPPATLQLLGLWSTLQLFIPGQTQENKVLDNISDKKDSFEKIFEVVMI